jgi:hypothetical protein
MVKRWISALEIKKARAENSKKLAGDKPQSLTARPADISYPIIQVLPAGYRFFLFAKANSFLTNADSRRIRDQTLSGNAALEQVNYSAPQKSDLTKGQVNALAESLASKVQYEPGDALEPIVEAFGGRIEYQSFWDLESSTSGSIQIQADGKFIIYLAAHTGPLRDRFTIAHELGHYILHFLYPRSQGRDPGPIQAQRYGSGPVEWEANWFAAGFLMPTQVFSGAFEKCAGDLERLASLFGVSLQSAEIRAQSLGLRR